MDGETPVQGSTQAERDPRSTSNVSAAAPTTRPEAHNDHARHLFPNKHHEVWPATPTRRLKLKAVAGGEAAHRRLEGAAAMHAFTSQRAAEPAGPDLASRPMLEVRTQGVAPSPPGRWKMPCVSVRPLPTRSGMDGGTPCATYMVIKLVRTAISSARSFPAFRLGGIT